MKAAEAAEKKVADTLGISPSELARLEEAYARLKTELDLLDQHGLSHLKERVSRNEGAGREFLAELERRRRQTLEAARARLQSVFSPAKWTSLLGYLDGQFRAFIKRSPAQ